MKTCVICGDKTDTPHWHKTKLEAEDGHIFDYEGWIEPATIVTVQIEGKKEGEE